jgi:hypothetical protein
VKTGSVSLQAEIYFSVELLFQKEGEAMKKTFLAVVVASAVCIVACMPTVVTKSVQEQIDPDGKKTVITTRTISQSLQKSQLDSTDDVLNKVK